MSFTGFRQAIAIALPVLLAACGWFDDHTPKEARVVIEGPAGAEVTLITSTRFLAGIDEGGVTRIEVLVADTSRVTLPFRQAWSIRSERQFFAQTERLDSEVSNLHMQVFINSRVEFDERGALLDDAPFRFAYVFNRLLTSTIQVVL